MSTTDERIRNIIENIQEKHRKQIDEKISSMIILGFVLGIFFSYTSLLGFCTGFTCGVITTRKFGLVAYDYTQNVINIFSGINNIIRGYIVKKIDN